MRALVRTANGLRITEAADPVPEAGQALVEVRSVSLNFGEVNYLARNTTEGEIPGWDAAGVVVRAAADGSGPAAGTPVPTIGWSAAWARLRAVDTENLAALPDGVDLGAASTLPVAGVTALQALRRLGSVSGRWVLVTGASGGVGRFAVRLAALAGARVIASANRPAGLTELGAERVVRGVDGVTGPLHGVLDNVGGPLLAEAFALLGENGRAVSIGKASGANTEIDLEAERLKGVRKQLEPFTVRTPFGPGLDYLISLLAAGKIEPRIGWRGSWDRVAEAIEALLSRQVTGKAVLDLTDPTG